jgi:diacylglycerol kinase family enzyme
MFIVLVNQQAGWVKRQSLVKIEKKLRTILGDCGKIVVTRQPSDVLTTLTSLELSEITALVPVGGDGTLSTVLTAACQCWSAQQLPAILPLCAGTMNMVAIDVRGYSEKPFDTLKRIVNAYRVHHQLPKKRYAFLLSNTGRAGFIGGMGIPTRFLSHYYSSGEGIWAAANSIFQYSAAVFLDNAFSKKMFKPIKVRLSIDDAAAEVKEINVILGLTVNRLPLGFQIGTAKQGEGMSLIYGNANARSLIANLPLIYQGFLPAGVGATRVTCQRFSIELMEPQPWQSDGDILPATTTLSMDASWGVDLLV